MMKLTWNNISGFFSIEVYKHEGKVFDSDDRELPIPAGIVNEDAELMIEFVSSGYCDPGRRHGSPDNCYPPEGEDERELETCYLDKVELSKEDSDKLWNFYENKIYEVELDFDYD